MTQGHINERTLVELRQRMLHCPAMIIFMDPDVAGRQARNRLSQEFPQALHAFVPQLQATSPVPSKCACFVVHCLRNTSRCWLPWSSSDG